MQSKRNISANSLMVILIIQALLAIVFLLLDPSESDRAIFWGYSSSKLLMIGIALSIFIFLIFLFSSYQANRYWFNRIKQKTKKACETKLGATGLILSLYGSVILCAVGMVTIALRLIGETVSGTLYSIFTNALPLILLMTAMNIEFVIIIKKRWHWQINLPNYSRLLTTAIGSELFSYIWILFTFVLSVIHWLSLSFQWQIFAKIPFWYWQTTIKSDFTGWLIIPLGILYFVGFWMIQKKGRSTPFKLAILFLVGIILIVGFAAMEGSPYQVLYDKRLISGHRDYVALAARKTGGSLFLFDYDQALGQNRFFATKPPGVYLLYRGLLGIGDIFFPTGTYQENYDTINHTTMILFPLLGLVNIVVVKKLTAMLTSIRPPELPAYLLLIIPNFLLLQATIDQAIIPLLASSILLLGIVAYQKKKPIFAISLGIAVYLGLYFSFSLLPWIIVLVIWYILELARQYDSKRLSQTLQLAGYAFGGFALMLGLFYLLFQYLPWERYFAAIAIHEVQRPTPIGIRAHLNMYLLNNLEFFTWIGFPLALTALLAALSAFVNFLWRKWSSLESLILATSSAYIFVNLFGNTISEVGRLWIFFVPLMCIYAIDFIQNKMKKDSYVIIFFALQFVTAFQIVKNILITWE